MIRATFPIRNSSGWETSKRSSSKISRCKMIRSKISSRKLIFTLVLLFFKANFQSLEMLRLCWGTLAQGNKKSGIIWPIWIICHLHFANFQRLFVYSNNFSLVKQILWFFYIILPFLEIKNVLLGRFDRTHSYYLDELLRTSIIK